MTSQGIDADVVLRDAPFSASFTHVLQSVTDEVRTLIGAHVATTQIALDRSGRQPICACSFSDQYAHLSRQITPRQSRGDCADSVVATPNLQRDSSIASSRRQGMRRDRLEVPLVSRQGCHLGTIEISNCMQGEFTLSDEAQLARFARIASLAIENALLYQSAANGKKPEAFPSTLPISKLETEVGRILSSHDSLNILLKDCVDAVARHLDVALARIWVSNAGVLELQASAGITITGEDGRCRMPLGQFTIGVVARSRQAHHTDSLQNDPGLHDKEWARRERLTAFAGIPLMCGGELMGVLAFFDRKPIPLDVIQAASSIAMLMAMTIRRHRSEDENDADSIPNSPLLLARFRTEPAAIVTSVNGTIVDWNAGAERCFGFAREEIVGHPVTTLVPPECAAEHQDMLAKIAARTAFSTTNTQRVRKDGTRVSVGLTAAGLHDSAGDLLGAVMVVHDLTEIQRLEHQYHQAQRMEVFGHLAGGVAHDFNNLLTIILGYSEIMLQRLPPGDSLRELLGEIRKASHRAESLTRQLLDFSRKDKPEAKTLDINVAVADTERMLRRLIGEDVLMTAIFSPSLKPIKLDPGNFEQILLNLAVNARDAMPRGGRLTIETNSVRIDREATGKGRRSGEFVTLAIRDTGAGMSEDTKVRLFEPLFTTKGPGKGTGLGLTIVHGIVKQAGGFIEVESELGRGTSFTVFFPAINDPLPVTSPLPASRALPRGKETVLLVEDEDSVRSLVREVLLNCGYTIFEATNGEEAVHFVEECREPIHLLVADVILPLLSGRSLVERLLLLRPQLRVLFLSGHTNDTLAKHGVREGEFAFLQKPFTTQTLAQTVRAVLDEPAQRKGA